MQVTVIMPTYNHERYVREAIESVFSQQVELELLIMDDGSTDGFPPTPAGRAFLPRSATAGPARSSTTCSAVPGGNTWRS